jgi:hypothetical protein
MYSFTLPHNVVYCQEILIESLNNGYSMNKRINLFLTRSFVVSVAVGAMTYLKPAIEEAVERRNFTRQHGLAVLYFTSFVGYNAWLRYSVDDEGSSYTPRGLPGRNKEEL